ncbi:putative pro-kumamolisin, activation domain [Lyophyllum shimeji]|uniref:tripeptidyl-peptidase II n=1 Tax=Lyophyllum shimeji TaxID=47721 RepID=A0A9P3URI5_LYOSH|nr:putative pro-kumamolisin, activation domain [Lyophyllum shimeji]
MQTCSPMIWSSAVLLSCLVPLFASKPLSRRWNEVVEKHSWAEIPRGWEYHSPAPAEYTFDIRLGLKQDKMDDLVANLMETSDPSHPSYGKHLSKAEAEALVAPHQDSVDAVEAWLQHHGIAPENIVHSTGGGGWVIVRVSVAQAERMLGTKYNVYHHTRSAERVVRTMSYSLPRELLSHVDVVTPTTYFSTLRSMRKTSFLQPNLLAGLVNDVTNALSDLATPKDCGRIITPACLRALYNTTDYKPAATDRNTIGVAGYLGEYANRKDLQTFFTKFRPDAVNSSYTTIQVNGGGDDQNVPGQEANLDIQYTTGMTFPMPNIYYSTAGSPPFTPDSANPTNTNEPYLEWLTFILNQTTIPQTITTSYGDDEQTVPEDYARKVCNLFAQLGSRGSTVFFSSGDYGVGEGDCKTNDGTNRQIFQPAFPASCPFVTAVGGTTGIPETAIDFSGGGFSRYFARPSYQASAVSSYLGSLGNTYKGLYNETGRAYPDISAQASGYQIVVGGKVTSIGGTSASSPTVAGVFALLNDYRLANGKSSLGFINPLIYSTAASGFNDIVQGSNPGCKTNGFSAKAGWDPVTGLGTPNFVKLQELV